MVRGKKARFQISLSVVTEWLKMKIRYEWEKKFLGRKYNTVGSIRHKNPWSYKEKARK